MTKLTKPVVRETAATERGDVLVAELHPRYLRLRLKGKRESFMVDYLAILDLARKLRYRLEHGGRI